MTMQLRRLPMEMHLFPYEKNIDWFVIGSASKGVDVGCMLIQSRSHERIACLPGPCLACRWSRFV